jgi:glycosyltransferase involved in cell wall biosynthesis
VVATRVGGTPDLLGDGRRGLLVPAGDADALAAGVVEALRGSDAVLARAREARAYVLAHHSSRRLIEDVDALYQELLSRPVAA